MESFLQTSQRIETLMDAALCTSLHLKVCIQHTPRRFLLAISQLIGNVIRLNVANCESDIDYSCVLHQCRQTASSRVLTIKSIDTSGLSR